MEVEHQLWITRIFNHHLSSPANWLLSSLGLTHDPARPWSDWMVCEILVAVFIFIFFGIMRGRFSVDRPGVVQHTLELIYEFIHAQAEEAAGHEGPKFMAFFGTIFLFILCLNFIGLIPGFDSPTMYPMVPLGFAVATFFYYNAVGIKANGIGYIRHFVGPMVWLAPLMIPIEIISHLARPLSLTLRLFANMFAGEQVYLTFISLTKVIIPAVFVGLHLFVSLLQAYIFMLLAMIYVGGAVSHEH
jgi:F-type H+-transporting ATPase subunit a